MKALFKAVKQDDYDKLQQLLKQKSDDNSLNINAKDKDGNTLLHLAATKGQIKILELLLQAGADLDLQDAQGRTPLVVAKEQQQEAAAQYLATYAKREIIESVDATAHPRLSSARWSSIQFARPPEQQDTESSSLLAQNLPPDVAQLLARCQLNERELEKAMVKLGELKRLLKKSPYGHVLYSLAIQRFLQKLAMWPLLTKRAVQQPENKGESKEKNEGEELKQQPSKDSFFTRHLWPKNKSVLVGDPKILKKVYGINGFFDGAGFVINRGWTGLILVLLGLDIYNYYAYPFDRDITNTKLSNVFLGTAGNEKSLSTLLLDPRIWPGILALPLLWGLGKALFSAQQKAWDTQAIDKITAQLNHYHPSVGKDLMQWLPALISLRLLPEPLIKRLLDQIERALLWDGHLQSKQRLKLFQAVRQLARTASQLTRLQALSTLAALADGVSPYDFPKLVEAGIDKEMLQTLLYLKTEAFSDLRNFAECKIYSEENEPITVSRLYAAYAHYQLWRLGQPQSYALQPLFWGITLVQFYLQSYLLWRVIQSVINLITFYVQKQECLNAGKLWLYMDQVADYVCSVCGDWPIFYRDIFEDKTCWQGYLQRPRTALEIVAAIKRINFDTIDTADFSQQPFTGQDLSLILPILKQKAQNLQALLLSSATADIDMPPHLGAQAIAEFIQGSNIRQLDLSGLLLSANDMSIITPAIANSEILNLDLGGANFSLATLEILAQAMPRSQVQVLTMVVNKLDDIGIAILAQGLPGSQVHDLNLAINDIGDAGAAALAERLSQSSIRNLDLTFNHIGIAGAAALGKNLPNSQVQLLNLYYNNISDAGATALGKGLSNSQIQELDLEWNNIGDSGAAGLAQGLIGSQIQTLDLMNNKISDAGTEALAQSLSRSKVQSLDLTGNEIGALGAAALGHGLPGSQVENLSLYGNKIGAGVAELSQGLPGSQIQSLNLRGNYIDDSGIATLAQNLPKSKVQNLDLTYNFIGDIGAIALARNLSDSSIQSLNLYGNYIGNTGLASLARALPQSQLKNLYIGENEFNATGIAALAQSLSESSIQHLELGGSFLNDIGIATLAEGLPGSQVQILSLWQNNIGETGMASLANILSESSIQILNLDFNNLNDAGTAALARGLPESLVRNLGLESNSINNFGATELAKHLPKSLVEELYLDNNNIGDAGAVALANVLTTARIFQELDIDALSPDATKALAEANPNTKLTTLSLESNQITAVGAKALCRVLPETNMSICSYCAYTGLDLQHNPIDPSQVDINTCYISSANVNKPYWLFDTAGQVYKTVSQYVDDSYQQIKSYFFSDSSEMNKIKLNIPRDYSSININNYIVPNTINDILDDTETKINHSSSYNTIPMIGSTSLPAHHVSFLPITISNYSTTSETLSESTIDSNLSLSEKWIVGQFIVGFVKKYTSFTLPWNREHSLTTQEQATLKHYQKQLWQLAQNFKHQRESRAATFESVADRFVYIDDHLPKIQQAITKAFKHNKITNVEFQEITITFNRLQECSQAIAKENQRLRKLEIKEYRQLRRTAKAGREQAAFQYSYDIVNQTLKHAVIKEKATIPVIPAWTPESRTQGSETFASLPTGSLLPCRDDKKVEHVSFAFGLLQQFWSRGNKMNAQPIAIEQTQDNIAKLAK